MILNWKGATDNVGVVKYYVYRNNVRIATTTYLTYTDSNISKGVSYTYQVSAVDAAGNESAKSFPITGSW